MAVKTENNSNGSDSTRSDSIGCSEACRELQEASSVELLRNSIFRSISKMKTVPKMLDTQEPPKASRSRRKAKSDLSLSDIEAKFLEKFTSMDSNLQIQPIHRDNFKNLSSQPLNPNEICLNHQNSSNSVLNSKIFDVLENSSNPQKTIDTEQSEGKDDVKENLEIGNLGKNSLKLAFRTSNNTIFEDCSTYNISCNDVIVPKTNYSFTNGENSANSGSELHFSDREKLLEDGFFVVDPDRQQNEEAEDQTPTLCDTFFSKVYNGDYVPIANNSTNKKLTKTKPENKVFAVVKDEEVEQEYPVDGSSNVVSKFSRRIRKRNRKSQSSEPHVYQCPQCEVSYTISTDMANDAAYCLHCDLWTSVEPEFLKREKQPWNTCRIC